MPRINLIGAGLPQKLTNQPAMGATEARATVLVIDVGVHTQVKGNYES